MAHLLVVILYDDTFAFTAAHKQAEKEQKQRLHILSHQTILFYVVLCVLLGIMDLFECIYP